MWNQSWLQIGTKKYVICTRSSPQFYRAWKVGWWRLHKCTWWWCIKAHQRSLTVTRGKKYCTLYKTQVKLCVGDVSIKEANSLKLWHRQLGHVSEKGLQVLAKGNFIFEIKLASWYLCSLFRVSFARKDSHRKSIILDLIQNDVCSPMKDDYSSILHILNDITHPFFA